MADTTEADGCGTATQIARALRIPVGTVHRYASERAIRPVGELKGHPVYDGRDVARVRHARNATRRSG